MSPIPQDADVPPAPTAPGGGPALEQLVRTSFAPAHAEALLRAFTLWAREAAETDRTVGLSICGPFEATSNRLDGLLPLLEGGHVDWIVARGEDLYLDAEAGFVQARGSEADPRVELTGPGERVRLGDQFFHRSQIESTEEFLGRLIVTPPFQKILATTELNALLGRFLDERDRALGLPCTSFLAAAHRQKLPVFSDSPGGSVLGRRIAAAALAGNRLVLDLSRDVNLAAAIVLHARGRGRSVVAAIGGGSPRDLLIQASRHLERPLGLGPQIHGFVLEVAKPGRARLAPRFAHYWGEEGPRLETVELASDLALPLLSAFWLQAVPYRDGQGLYASRDLLLEHLRDHFLRHDLERQVRATSAQIQSQIQSKLEETQATFQAEMQRVQHQLQQQVERLLHAVRRRDGEE